VLKSALITATAVAIEAIHRATPRTRSETGTDVEIG